jgi:hypothetical protein
MARRKASASELLFAAIIGMAVWTITPGDAFLMAGPQSVGVVGAGLGGSASGRWSRAEADAPVPSCARVPCPGVPVQPQMKLLLRLT